MNLLACQPLYAPILGGLGMYSPVVVDDATPAIAKPVKPENPVTRSSWSGSFGYGSFPGFGIVDTRLSDQMYRRMANHPMIIKVKTRICKPVEDGIRTIEVVDQGAGPELCAEIKKAAEQDLLPRLNECVPGSMESLLYGKWLYETVWSKTADGRIAPVELQSVLPGEGTLHVDGVRRFAGYDINGQFRDARYGVLFVHDPHIDRVLGRSCCDAALVAFLRSLASSDNADSIERRASGIQFLFHVMQGVEVVDASGNVIDGMKLCESYMNAAVTGKSGIVPDMWFSKEAIENNPELAKIPYFRAEQFDWGNNGPALMAHLSRLVRLDNELYAAFGVSERAVSEAQNGASKSDAESHGDAVVAISGQEHARTCAQWDAQVTNRWFQANYAGVKCRVWTRPKRADPQQEFLQGFITTLASNTNPDPEIASNIDKRALLERLDMPLLSIDDAKAKLQGIQDKQAADNETKLKQLQAGKQQGNPQDKEAA